MGQAVSPVNRLPIWHQKGSFVRSLSSANGQQLAMGVYTGQHICALIQVSVPFLNHAAATDARYIGAARPCPKRGVQGKTPLLLPEGAGLGIEYLKLF